MKNSPGHSIGFTISILSENLGKNYFASLTNGGKIKL